MNLKSVELVRNTRDENYQKCRNMTTQEQGNIASEKTAKVPGPSNEIF